ncbi:cytochrome c oxidase subunit II [Tessaracoccus sp. OS52]|uniref:aa3-type cytochrome oxidase subunit II n=1 Tax=Tessaracoccus sp. OS52 TaxID=2886691 RepID=UPI001D0F984E|nr:cytochrome c oxidase subunit II [Tessaracoccus sp. OS52]MCC2593441.1 cytochrome c oxidase subunit II [Tessaracoccus sp. OS52]
MTACSGQGARFGLPEAASAEAPNVSSLWIGAWIASLIIGGLVWGLIGWSVVRYRHKEGVNSAPRQTKYHLPLELLYTLVPFLIVGVLFFYTVRSADAMKSQTPEPDLVIDVIGQKWSWTFNYNEADNPAIGVDAHESGTLEKIPDLYLPVNKTVRINLQSPDVIHSFWVPSFYYKLDVIPGHPNSMDVTPNKIGVYDGKCAELCGTYHALMLFEVHVVSEEDYNAYVTQLADSGNEGVIEMPSSLADTLPQTETEGDQ